MRSARQPRRVANGDFGDARAVKTGKCRNEAVQLAVQVYFLEHFGPIGFESCAKVAELNA